MNRTVLFTALLGLAVSPHAHAQGPLAQVARSNRWHDGFESARAAAKKTGKPLMIVLRCEP